MFFNQKNDTGPALYTKSKMPAVLDLGFIEVLEVMGSDLTVVNAARVSFHKESHEMTLGDSKLIKYLAKYNHVTPFFHPQIRLRLKMPIFVAREWFRHQIGFARNEVSRRYVDDKPECYTPVIARARDAKVKQGSKDDGVPENERAVQMISTLNQTCMDTYDQLLGMGVAPEVARTILPQGMFTEFIETGSLAAYARLCQLRLDPSAQWEIRQYAEAVRTALLAYFPVSWDALTQDTPA